VSEREGHIAPRVTWRRRRPSRNAPDETEKFVHEDKLPWISESGGGKEQKEALPSDAFPRWKKGKKKTGSTSLSTQFFFPPEDI